MESNNMRLKLSHKLQLKSMKRETQSSKFAFLSSWYIFVLNIIIIILPISLIFNYFFNVVKSFFVNGFGMESLLGGRTGEQSYNFGISQFTNIKDLTVFHILPVLGILGFALVFAFKIRKKFLPLNLAEQKGDSRFSTLSEIQQAYKEVDQLESSFKGHGGIPVARYKDKLYLDDQTVNTVIIGTSRSGKGETFVFPTIDVTSRAEEQSSLVINDPKGELYTGSYETLRKRGYDIEVINMISPEDSLSYNPLALIIEAYTNGDMETAQQLTESLTFSLYMTGDPEADFWNSLASSLVGASILALCGIHLTEDTYEPEKITMRNVQTFITTMGKQKVKEDGVEKTKLDIFFNTLDNSDVAKMQYSATEFAEGKTRSSIFVSALEKLKLFNADSMARMTSKNTIDFSLVGFPKQIRLFTNYKLVGQSVKAEFYKKNMDEPFGEDVGQVKRLIKDKEPYGSLKICFDEKLTDGDSIHLIDGGNIDLWYSFKRLAKNALNPTNEYGLVEYRDKASTKIIKNKDQKGLEFIQSMETYYIDKPKAIFLLVPDYDRSRAMLSSIFIKQMYQTLATMCQDVRGNKLHRRLKFLLDEFGNMTPIKEMDSIMTVCLGRNILFDLVVQGYNQITALYGDEKGQSIKDNCQNHLYILSTSSTTTKEISEKLGYRTIELNSNSGDSTELEQKNSKSIDRQPLIEPFNLLRFEEGEMLVLRSLKRQTNKKEKVKAYPIYNTGDKRRMKYRYEYLSNYFFTGKSTADFPIKSIHKYMDLDSVALDFTEIDNQINSKQDDKTMEPEGQQTAFDKFNVEELNSINEVLKKFFINITTDKLKEFDFNSSNETISNQLIKLVTDPKQSKVTSDLLQDDYKGLSSTKFRNLFKDSFHKLFSERDTEKTSQVVSAAKGEMIATRTEESSNLENENIEESDQVEIEGIKEASGSNLFLTKDILETSYFSGFFLVYNLSASEIVSETEQISETELVDQINNNLPQLVNLFKDNLTNYRESNNTK